MLPRTSLSASNGFRDDNNPPTIPNYCELCEKDVEVKNYVRALVDTGQNKHFQHVGICDYCLENNTGLRERSHKSAN